MKNDKSNINNPTYAEAMADTERLLDILKHGLRPETRTLENYLFAKKIKNTNLFFCAR